MWWLLLSVLTSSSCSLEVSLTLFLYPRGSRLQGIYLSRLQYDLSYDSISTYLFYIYFYRYNYLHIENSDESTSNLYSKWNRHVRCLEAGATYAQQKKIRIKPNPCTWAPALGM
jgi:hypothetical protein